MSGCKVKPGVDGCSIVFFVACQKALKTEYGDRVVDASKLNEMTKLLGRAERLYLEMKPKKEE